MFGYTSRIVDVESIRAWAAESYGVAPSQVRARDEPWDQDGRVTFRTVEYTRGDFAMWMSVSRVRSDDVTDFDRDVERGADFASRFGCAVAVDVSVQGWDAALVRPDGKRFSVSVMEPRDDAGPTIWGPSPMSIGSIVSAEPLDLDRVDAFLAPRLERDFPKYYADQLPMPHAPHASPYEWRALTAGGRIFTSELRLADASDPCPWHPSTHGAGRFTHVVEQLARHLGEPLFVLHDSFSVQHGYDSERRGYVHTSWAVQVGSGRRRIAYLALPRPVRGGRR